MFCSRLLPSPAGVPFSVGTEVVVSILVLLPIAVFLVFFIHMKIANKLKQQRAAANQGKFLEGPPSASAASINTLELSPVQIKPSLRALTPPLPLSSTPMSATDGAQPQSPPQPQPQPANPKDVVFHSDAEESGTGTVIAADSVPAGESASVQLINLKQRELA